MEPRPEYITPTELATLLRDPSARHPVIVDVRDEDFAGGHIRSAINVPEFQLREDAELDALIEKLEGEEQVVFHCFFSQVRGPTCAKRFLARLAATGRQSPVVKVLAGGYTRFAELYKGDTDLLED